MFDIKKKQRIFTPTKNMEISCIHKYTVRDIHSGDNICEEGGLIVSDND